MLEDEIYQRVLTRILDFVSGRARTVSEVERKIDALLKGRTTEEVSQSIENKNIKIRVMEKLSSLKLLSDFQYAKDYLNEKVNSSSPVGPGAVKKFLYHKGVSSELIKNTVSTFSSQDEKNAIEKLLERKMRLVTKRDLKTKNKIIRFLLYRGFSSKAIFPAVDTKFEVK